MLVRLRPVSCALSRSLSSARYLLPNVDPEKIAIRDSNGSHSFEKVGALATAVSDYVRSTSTRGARVALLMPPCVQFPAAMIGIMNANCVPVPMNHRGTEDELEYLLNNCEASVVLTSPETDGIISDDVTNYCLDGSESATPGISYADIIGGIMIYTSGTTGKPKGCLSGHEAFRQWTNALVDGWQITSDDSILHTLPLYHVHGILAIFSVLSQGGTVDLRQKFDAGTVWNEFLGESPPTLYYGVPTQYSKLIEHYRHSLEGESVKEKMARLRLMVSGSAALRAPVSDAWHDITGHRLLERYGMTEIGLAISNPYAPVSDRKPGCIGLPFTNVKVRLVADNGDIVAQAESGQLLSATEGESGEVQISGPTLFTSYFNNPTATAETFTEDGWFKTGDTAEIDGGVFKILGRTSSDVIKSGGYKLSALEIERTLLDHDHITDAAVIGVEDEVWGQKVVAIVESNLSEQLELDELDLRGWSKGKMSPYKVPKDFILVKELPRNHMGKVNKKSLVAKYSESLK